MPIYEYQCPQCGHVFEEWVKAVESLGEEPCPQCGAAAPRVMSQTSFVLKGGGWYVSDYGYRKGIKEDGTPSTTSAEGNGKSAGKSGAEEQVSKTEAGAANRATPPSQQVSSESAQSKPAKAVDI